MAFLCFFVSVVVVLTKRFDELRWMFFLLLVINLIIWVKVSTDIFPVFAVYLSASFSDDAMNVKQVKRVM